MLGETQDEQSSGSKRGEPILHRRENDRTFLVIVSTYLVGPSTQCKQGTSRVGLLTDANVVACPEYAAPAMSDSGMSNRRQKKHPPTYNRQKI